MENYLEKNKKRDLTRFNLEKKKKECSKYFWLKYIENDNPKDLEKRVGKMSHNPKSCSCWMCSNPRKHYKGRLKGRLTLAEIKIMKSIELEDITI